MNNGYRKTYKRYRPVNRRLNKTNTYEIKKIEEVKAK